MNRNFFSSAHGKISRILAGLIMFSLLAGSVSAQKIANKPVEPFYRAVSATVPAEYEPEVTYLSPEKAAPIEFSSLGASWSQQQPAGTSVEVEVRLKSKGKYSAWYQLDASTDDKYGEENQGEVSSFLTTSLADGYQYRVSLNSQTGTDTPILDNLKFTFINGGTPQQRTNLLADSISPQSGADLPLVRSTGLVAQAESTLIPAKPKSTVTPPAQPIRRKSTTSSSLKIISRADWGADESLRLYNPDTQKDAKLVTLEDDYYTKFADELKESRRVETDENGKPLTWPLSYPESVKKIIVHHTATAKDLDDPMKAIRDIYIWHTISKGWGDIGYNYIIDQQGNIYEGRYGGEMVVGAHAGRGNHGSIGIAVLGNFQDEDPPEAVVTALTALIKEKAQKYNIDTEGDDLFRGENYPNIMGHREIMSTACPGDKLFELLPLVRQLSKVKTTAIVSAKTSAEYNFGWAGTGAPVFTIPPKTKKTVTLRLKNIGSRSWDKATYFKVINNKNSQTFLKNSQEILTGTTGREVKPGETVEIKLLLNATAVGGSGLIDLQQVIGGKTSSGYLSFGLQVNAPAPKKKYDYSLISIIYGKNEFKAGETVDVTIKLRNKGTAPWQKTGSNKLSLGADKPRDHKNVLLAKPAPRLAALQEDLVQSGEIGTFKFSIKIPAQDGIYREYFTPVVEGIQWMDNHNTFLQVKVGNSDRLMTPDVEDAAAPQSTKTAAASTGPNIAVTTINTQSRPRDIRVDLAYRGNPAVISANGNFSLFEGNQKVADFKADQQVNVQYDGAVFKVTGNLKTHTISGRPRFQPSLGTIMRIDNWERRNTWGDKANNNLFRGVLEVLIYNKELHVINELPLEDYLKGIAEESSTAPAEKIKTIMVIARTYARFYMDVVKKFPGAPFDLNDDPNYSQKYLGYAFESRSPETARLAAATAGQYVTYNGKLIKTPYFSKSDGKKTISAADKWGWTDTPFLVSVDDSMCDSTAFSGHGVGLSGCGATALAKQGKSYREIIKYYYQGVEVTQTDY